MKNIANGMKAYLGAFNLISKLKLWKYFVIPILISIVTATIIFSMAYTFSDSVGDYLASFWKWDFGKQTFSFITSVLGGILIVVLGLILYKHIVLALSSPFISPVSEKIERHLKGENYKHRHIQTSFKEQLIRGIRISIRNISLELLFTLPLLILSLIPVIGIFFAVISFLVQAYYAGFGNMDSTLERHYKYDESIQFVKRNKGLAIGNGIVFMLFLLIPFIGIIIVLPLSVTAATTETIKRIK